MIESLQRYLETSPHSKMIAGTSIVACVGLFFVGWVWMMWVIAQHDRSNMKNSFRIPFFIIFWGCTNWEVAKKPLILLLLSLGGLAFLVWVLPKQAKRTAHHYAVPPAAVRSIARL